MLKIFTNTILILFLKKMRVPTIVRLLAEYPPQKFYEMVSYDVHNGMRSHMTLLNIAAALHYSQSPEELEMDVYTRIEYMWRNIYSLLKQKETWEKLSENEHETVELLCALLLKYWKFETYTEGVLINSFPHEDY